MFADASGAYSLRQIPVPSRRTLLEFGLGGARFDRLEERLHMKLIVKNPKTSACNVGRLEYRVLIEGKIVAVGGSGCASRCATGRSSARSHSSRSSACSSRHDNARSFCT